MVLGEPLSPAGVSVPSEVDKTRDPHRVSCPNRTDCNTVEVSQLRGAIGKGGHDHVIAGSVHGRLTSPPLFSSPGWSCRRKQKNLSIRRDTFVGMCSS
jgi:hypothetical protein